MKKNVLLWTVLCTLLLPVSLFAQRNAHGMVPNFGARDSSDRDRNKGKHKKKQREIARPRAHNKH